MKLIPKKESYRFSLIIPIFNEIPNLTELFKRLKAAQKKWKSPYEIIFINDGSTDKSLNFLQKNKKSLQNVKIIDFSRNFGHQAALFAGLKEASGDLVACIDADLQDPPELLNDMVLKLEKHRADVVYGVRKNRKEGPVKVFCYWLAYRVLRKIFKLNLPLDSGDFCVMNRKVVNILVSHHDQNLFLRGLRAWVGFKQEAYPYVRAARAFGNSKYSYFNLISLALNGIVGFTSLPIYFLGILGVIGLLISFIYISFLITAFAFSYPTPAGFYSVMAAILFFSSIQLCAFATLGFYVFKNYEETRKRPLYLIKKIL